MPHSRLAYAAPPGGEVVALLVVPFVARDVEERQPFSGSRIKPTPFRNAPCGPIKRYRRAMWDGRETSDGEVLAGGPPNEGAC